MGRGINILLGLILIAIVTNFYIKYLDISNFWYGLILIVVGVIAFLTSKTTTESYSEGISKKSTITNPKSIFIGGLVLLIGVLLLLVYFNFTIPYSQYSMILVGIFGVILLLSK